MNFNQVQRFRQLLIKACDKHIAAGGKIVSGCFCDGLAWCPISCLCGSSGIDAAIDFVYTTIGTATCRGEAWAFIAAFDGCSLPEKQFVSMVLLGKELRAKYITK